MSKYKGKDARDHGADNDKAMREYLAHQNSTFLVERTKLSSLLVGLLEKYEFVLEAEEIRILKSLFNDIPSPRFEEDWFSFESSIHNTNFIDVLCKEDLETYNKSMLKTKKIFINVINIRASIGEHF